MRFHQDRSARSLIYAAGFHAYHAVFHDIYDTDAVLAAQTVQLADNVGHFHRFSVDGCGDAFLKSHGDVFRFIRGFFRRYAQYQHVVVVRLIGRILQFQTFMTDVP